MRVKIIGHACLLIQAAGLNIYTDLWFNNEMFGFCRRFPDPGPLIFDLPAPDLVFLSHHHWDHVDVKSLDRLDRSTPFLIPHNQQLIDILDTMGFTEIKQLAPWEEFQIQTLKFVATRSRVPFGEVGLLAIFDGCAVWNMVDTVFEADDIERVNQIIEENQARLNLTIAPYQSFDEMSFLMRVNSPSTGFTLSKNAKALRSLKTDLITPGADGVYYPGNEYLNKKCFVHTPFQFIDAILAENPDHHCMVSLPLDEFYLEKGQTRYTRQIPIKIVELLQLYEEFRSLDLEYPHQEVGEGEAIEDADFEYLKGVFHEDLFMVYPQEVLDLFRVLSVQCLLEVMGTDHCLLIDFMKEQLSWGDKRLKDLANCGIKLQYYDLLDLCASRQLISIMMQSDRISVWGEDPKKAYRALDVLWYAGFEDKDRLHDFVEFQMYGEEAIEARYVEEVVE